MIKLLPEIADAGFLRGIGIIMVVTTLAIGALLIGSLPPRSGNLAIEAVSVLPLSIASEQLSPQAQTTGEP